MKRLHFYIFGKVHGVFFRDSARRKAEMLGVKGWARNVQEGVEIVAEGREAQVRQLAEWCQRGPPGAEVERVEVKEEMFKGEFKTFEILF